jgi:tetratricopeptide (TPR) repeat protein
VQLIDAAGRRVRWAGAFQRPTEDLFAVISAVADSVATAVVGALAPAERARLARRPTTSNAALADYARGIAAMRRYDEPSLRFATSAFESAIAQDSAFADAWAGLAESLVWRDAFLPPRVVYPRARVAAERALSLQPGSSRALAALSVITNGYDWDPQRAESLARRALRLDSANVRARLYLADALVAQGRADDAVPAYRAALAADTLDEQVASEVADGMLFSRRPDEALSLTRPWQARRPGSDLWDLLEAGVLTVAGRCASSPPRAPISFLALRCAGRTAEARTLADSQVAQAERGTERGTMNLRPDVLAWMFAGLGDREAALRWLARAVEARCYLLAYARVDPMWDAFRDDPRFQALLERVRPEGR